MGDPAPQILVCVDFSEGSETVLATAARLARSTDATLHLLHAAAPEPTFFGYDPPGGPRDRDTRAEELRDEHEALRVLADAVREFDVPVVPLLVNGSTLEVIQAEADRLDADLIVVGSHGHGAVRRFLVGSTVDALVRTSERPVLVVPVRPPDDEGASDGGAGGGVGGSDDQAHRGDG